MNNDVNQHIRQICLNLLTRSELSRTLLVRKLSDRGYTSDDVLDIVDELVEQGLQSDQRYTEQYIAMRARKGFGPERIRLELEQRGIEPVAAQSAVAALHWNDNIASVYKKKYKQSSVSDWSEYTKRMRFLHYRGFTTEQINQLMQSLEQHNNFQHTEESGY
ncbi:MAG TPA: regulatory protein RecX [Crenotrichaceae bacterium]|nr:regulatory protein RecX [Crenotrichaceae bacterium]